MQISYTVRQKCKLTKYEVYRQVILNTHCTEWSEGKQCNKIVVNSSQF